MRKGDFKAAGELRVIGSGAVTFDKLKSVPKFDRIDAHGGASFGAPISA